MKALYKSLLLAAVLGSSMSSCSKGFLDIVPDERPGEIDTYADREAGLKYLYSCYGYLPSHANTAGALDVLTGDETITSFEHELFSSFPKGNFSGSNPVISYWNTFFQGIRQCYMFLDVVDKLPNTTEEEKRDYRGQANFLIAYYHYRLIQSYGPVSIIENTVDINMPSDQYPERRSLDESIAWVAAKFDEAAQDLPAVRDVKSRYGLATSVAAKGLKAKLLVYAASPLFNGTATSAPIFADFKDKKGNNLMPTSYDPQKWVKARDAVREAITFAESNGHTLYMKTDYRSGDNSANAYPAVGVVRRLRTGLMDWQGQANPETLMADTRGPGYYDYQLKSTPKTTVDQGANGLSLSWAMVNRFYTKNGLPWDEDPEFRGRDKMQVVTVDQAHNQEAHEGAKTMAFNLDREPRFYAWVGFQGGYYEVLNGDDNAYPIPSYMPVRGRVLLDFTKNGNQGRKERNNNYTPSAYLNKKYTDPNMIMRRNGPQTVAHPYTVLRLADLYLLYAESCVETGDLATAKEYLDKVRTRAGIPTVDAAWAPTGVALDQAKLRQIARQERQIEMYLEAQNFWDMRRWLLAGEAFNKKSQGLNIEGTSVEALSEVREIVFERKFISPTHYLLPIPSTDINRNLNLVQNPGY